MDSSTRRAILLLSLTKFFFCFFFFFSFLDPNFSRQYENFKKSYSNILHKWQLFNKSAEVQKHMALLPDPKEALGQHNTLHILSFFFFCFYSLSFFLFNLLYFLSSLLGAILLQSCPLWFCF